MDAIKIIEEPFKKEITPFRIGDTIKVTIKVFEGKQLDCKRLFIYTLKKYTEYAYKYYTLTSNHVLFEKYFLHKNPILQCSNSQIRILF